MVPSLPRISVVVDERCAPDSFVLVGRTEAGKLVAVRVTNVVEPPEEEGLVPPGVPKES